MENHTIDSDKLAEVFKRKWYHPKIVGGYQQKEPIEQPHLFNVYIEPVGSELSIDINTPNDLILFPGFISSEVSSKILFKNITNVYYFKYTRVFVVESVNETSFSQLLVFGDGEFDLTVNIPIDQYPNAFAKSQAQKEKAYQQ